MIKKCHVLTLAAALLLALGVAGVPRSSEAASLSISNNFSPYNKKRSNRPYTKYIVLHTTENLEKGSLRKVVREGLAHYFVDTHRRLRYSPVVPSEASTKGLCTFLGRRPHAVSCSFCSSAGRTAPSGSPSPARLALAACSAVRGVHSLRVGRRRSGG